MNDKPIRIQRKRTNGWRMPENTLYVGRGTLWGNHFTMADEEQRSTVITKFRCHLDLTRQRDPDFYERYLNPLRGKNLACFCPLDKACHADVLLELANAP